MRLKERLEVIYVLYDWKDINGMQQMIEPEVGGLGTKKECACVGYGVFWRQRKRARRGMAARFLMNKEEQAFQNPKLGVPKFYLHKASRKLEGRRTENF